jgi:hypothetical protein
MAFGKFLAEAVVARQVRACGRDEVAHPGQPGEGERVGAGRYAKPGHLCQATSQQPGLAVVAEAETVGGTRRDGDHVLERPAQFDAQDVLVDVQPEATSGDPCRDTLGELDVGGATTADAGRLRATSAARFGPDSAATGRSARPRLGDDLAHAQQRPALQALDHRQQVRVGRQEGSDRLDGLPQVCRRCREDDQVGGVAQCARIGRRDHRRRQVDPGSRASFRPVAAIRAAVSGEWLRSVTGSIRATTLASVVPHAPAPTTATSGPAISAPCSVPSTKSIGQGRSEALYQRRRGTAAGQRLAETINAGVSPRRPPPTCPISRCPGRMAAYAAAVMSLRGVAIPVRAIERCAAYAAAVMSCVAHR